MLADDALSTLFVDARSVDHPTARQRGIGRHVTGLLQGLVQVGAPVVALCSNDAEREIVGDSVDGLEIGVLSPDALRSRLEPGTWFLATQLMLHPITLDPIPSVVTRARLPVAALMYDVIPYRHPTLYLTDPSPRAQAQLRVPLARTVDLMLANSEFVRQTAAAELGYPIERIRTVGVGVNSNFQPASVVSHPWPTRVLPAGVDRYVVSVTGTDERKNTEGLLRGWALLPDRIRRTHRLVIATGHTPAVLRRWRQWAAEVDIGDEVVFTGNVTDDEMVALLQNAALSVFPSLDEGFGLPVVEAAACGCPVICSGITSLPEVLDEPQACFDPSDPSAIAEAMVRALEDDSHRQHLLAAGRRATLRWTWYRVASDIIETLTTLGPRWPQRMGDPPRRIAFAGVFAGLDAGFATSLGHYNEALVAAVTAIGIDSSVFVDGSGTPEPTHASPRRWPVRALGRFVKPWDFDHVVAILGTAVEHVATSELAGKLPCHLWIDDDGLEQVNPRALSIARSVIVGSDPAAERVRRARVDPCPVLVVSGAPEHAATALVEWLDDVDDLDPSTIRHR